ncbi:hypothetical protein TWF694_003129 [Orbilia ellipsospora]|uniref:BTB domain-containing protein n=1 Tax=Orbilia ellipsospora TaxID=2528407 RepID=A0AAV9X0U5_9PEZI
MEPLNIHDVDKYGDVLATCSIPDENEGEDLGTLRISSKALSLASPVLQAMLDPGKGFQESKVDQASGAKKIRLEAETLESVLLAMNIIHHRHSKNPKELDLMQIYQLATFCDKYQLQAGVFLAIEVWSAPLWRIATSSRTYPLENYAYWLWIGKVFRMKEVLEICTPRLIRNIKFKHVLSLGDASLHPGMSTLTHAILNERDRRIEKLVVLLSRIRGEIEAAYLKCQSPAEFKDSRDKFLPLGLVSALLVELGSGQRDMPINHFSILELFSIIQTTFSWSNGLVCNYCRYGREHTPDMGSMTCKITELTHEMIDEEFPESLLSPFLSE